MPTPPAALDDIDRELIALLRANARTPVVALAKALRLTRNTVQHRIDRLEQAGVILGYTVKLRPETESGRLRAVMSIAVEGSQGEAVRRALWGHAQVVGLHTTNGRWDLIAELRADSLEAFNTALGEIRRIPGIAGSETSLLLATDKA